jgi:hypothetical protein
MGMVLAGACSGSRPGPPVPPPRPAEPTAPARASLRPPEAFAAIADRSERSQALFLEASRVITHPRCINCHPDGDVPHQGPSLALHDPPVTRGADDHGVVNMRCDTCHQEQNQALTRVPGAPKWAVAPLEMAWVGKTPGQICAQLKDRKRNGGKSLDEIVEHMAHDPLVAWGWAPGADREPAPGTQAELGALMKAWQDTGAVCP